MRVSRVGLLGCFVACSLLLTATSSAADTPGTRLPGARGVRERTTDIMARQALAPSPGSRPEHELDYPSRKGLPQNPEAPALSRFPAGGEQLVEETSALEPRTHTTALSFDGATLTDTGAFPPDSMGTVGPSQYVVFVNGRLRSFTKGGVADGVLNASPDIFFASVMTPVSPPVVLNFTSDPQVRY